MEKPLKVLRVLFFLGLVALAGCTQKLYPPSCSHAYLIVDNRIVDIRVEPYINAMPGAQSNDVIIPIGFYLNNPKQGEPWPRKFKLTRVKVSGIDKSLYQKNDLDHDQWMHNVTEDFDSNVLRVPIDKMPSIFDITIWFKDDKGRRYRVKFHDLGAGEVY